MLHRPLTVRALEEVEKLADWMDLRLDAVRWPGGENSQKGVPKDGFGTPNQD